MFDLGTVQSVVERSIGGSPRGVRSVFIPISEKWAIKLFGNTGSCNAVMKNHRACLNAGMAPEMGEMFMLPEPINGDGRGYTCGYFVEIVETCPNLDGNGADYLRTHGEEELEKARAEVEAWRSELYPLIRDLVDEICEKTGWYFDDAHVYNWGKKNGKFIPIDFD